MKTKIVLVFLVLGMMSFVLAGKVVMLPDLINPTSIAADGERLYIIDQTSVYIFSSKDIKLLKAMNMKVIRNDFGRQRDSFENEINIEFLRKKSF